MDLVGKLIEEGLLDREKVSSLEEEVKKTGKTKEEVILRQKAVTEEDLFNVKSKIVEVPLKRDVDSRKVSEAVLRMIPEETTNLYKMIPIGKSDEEVEIGMVYPEDLRAREALKFILRRENIPYRVYLIPFSVFEEVALRHNPSPRKIKSLLLEKMVEKEFFGEEDAVSLEKQVNEEKKSVEEVLLERNTITEEELFDIKSEATGVPLKKEIKEGEVSSDVLSLINEDFANRYKLVPIGKTGEEVEVGMIYPEDPRAREALKFISRQSIFSYKIYLISFSVFEKAKEKYGDQNKSFGKVLMEKMMERGLLEEDKMVVIEEEAKRENKTKEEILLQKEIISEEDLFALKSEITGIPLKKDVDFDSIDEELFRLFSEDAVSHYKMIPIGKEGENVEIGMVYPEDIRAQEGLKLIFEKEDLSYNVNLISLSEFKKISKNIKAFTKEIRSTLIDRLVEEGVLDQERAKEIEKNADDSDKTKEEILLEEKIINEDELFSLKSEVLGFQLKNDLNVKGIPEDLLRLIPEDSANYYKMAPIGKTEEGIEIGMVYPENLRAKEALNFLARRDNFSYEVYLIPPSTFEEIAKQYRTLTKEVGEALEDVDIDIEDAEESSLDVDRDIGRLAEEAPIVKVVAVILKNAIEGGASDIHIEPSREKLKIRFRVDGTLYASLYLPMAIHLATVARIKILAGLKIDEQRLPQDGRFSTKKKGKNVDFRVSTFPTTLGEKVVIRVLDPTEGLKSLDELGFMERNLHLLKESIKRPTGMTLLTGPTGSGKSTTLYAAMDILNKDMVNIVTLEDPVEYFMDGINQSQVHPEIGYVFSKGLRQILRQDPDVIMVGEIRDDETAELAIHAALTGHVVLSTLHTNNAIGGIPRLIDMGIKPFLIPPAINSLISQRLVKGLCSKCKEQITPSEEIKALIESEIKNISPDVLKDLDIPSPFKIYTAKGCKHCSEGGVEGRLAINEIIKMTSNLGEITMKNPNVKELEKEAKKQGMVTLRQDGMIKVIKGYTTIEEVLRATEEK